MTAAEFQRLLRSQKLSSGYETPAMLANKADDYFQSTDFFTDTYGRKVWDSLNNQTRLWNMLRKTKYDKTTGWRIRDSRPDNTRSVPETGALGDVASQNFNNVYSRPKHVITMFGVTVLSEFLGPLEGGIGNALATEQGLAETDHIKEINKRLWLPAVLHVSTAGASGTAAVVPADGVRVGDVYHVNSNVAKGGIKITAANQTSGVISFTRGDGAAGTATDLVDGETLSVKSRQGATSLDEIVEYDGRPVSGAQTSAADVYNITTRAKGSYGAAAEVVDSNFGTLSLDNIDDCITSVRDNGGDPDLIVTDWNTLQKIEGLLRSDRRYFGDGMFKVKFSGEDTLPGFQTGFQVSTYKGIPIIGDPDATRTSQAADTLASGNLYVLDTNFLEVKVASPTRYFESRDYLQNNILGIKAMFWTMYELCCLDFTKQAKVARIAL